MGNSHANQDDNASNATNVGNADNDNVDKYAELEELTRTTTSRNLIFRRFLFLRSQFSVTAFDVRVHRADFSPDSRYLVFESPFWVPVAIYLRSHFPLRFSPLFDDLEFSPFGIVGVLHCPASAYTAFALSLPDWVTIFGVCKSPRAVSHG